MQYRIEHIAGWKNQAIIRVKDGVVIGHVYAEHADEIKPYLGQGVDVAEAVELLHRVLNYFVGEFAFPEKMERLLEEIEVFLTDLEAEERDALRK